MRDPPQPSARRSLGTASKQAAGAGSLELFTGGLKGSTPSLLAAIEILFFILRGKMGDNFICSVCGVQHDGLITNRGYKLPDDVWSIPDHERSEKARFDSDLCQFGERYFIRCVLFVPFADRSGEFGWGVWVEVEWATFERYLELYEVDGSSEPAHRGLLANVIPGYPPTLGADIEIGFQGASERPTVHFTAEDHSPLAEEQRRGMSDARYHEILNLLEASNQRLH